MRMRPSTFIKTVDVGDFYIKQLLIKTCLFHSYYTLFQFAAEKKKKK